MSHTLICPGCKVRLTVGDDRAGTSFDCPSCDTAVHAPSSSSAAPPQIPTDSQDIFPTNHRSPLESHASWWRARSPKTKRWIRVAGLSLVAGVVAWMAVAAVRGVPPPVGERKDMSTFTIGIKQKIPVQIDQFKKIGLKAESYSASDKYPNLFGVVTVPVDRVYLEDPLTRGGDWYTRARLTSCYHNSNEPTVRTSSAERFATGSDASALREIWISVEMLP